MCREDIVRMVAGALVFAGVLLAWLLSPWWLILPGFVGLNLFQSSLTGICPLEMILKRAGVPDRAGRARGGAEGAPGGGAGLTD